MELMDIRRGLMMGMAKGLDYVGGTITIDDSWYNYVFQFGKSFGKYIYYFEMTDEGKSDLLSSGSTVDNTFAFLGVYPSSSIGSDENDYTFKTSVKVSDSTEIRAVSTNSPILSCNPSSLVLQCRAVTTRSAFYKGYTYNYYIVEIK